MRLLAAIAAALLLAAPAQANDKAQLPSIYGKPVDPGLKDAVNGDVLMMLDGQWSHAQLPTPPTTVSPYADSRNACPLNASGQDAQPCLAAWLVTCQGQGLICVLGGFYYTSTTLAVGNCPTPLAGISMHGAGLIGNAGMATNLMSVNCNQYLEMGDFALIGSGGQTALEIVKASGAKLRRMQLVGGTGFKTDGGPGSSAVVNWSATEMEVVCLTNYAADLDAPGDSSIRGGVYAGSPSCQAVIRVQHNGGLRISDVKIENGQRGIKYDCPMDSLFQFTGSNIEGPSLDGIEFNDAGCGSAFANVTIQGDIDATPIPINMGDGALHVTNVSISGTMQCNGANPAVIMNAVATGIVAISQTGCSTKYSGGAGVAVYGP